MRLDSFFSGAMCVISGGRLPEALFMVFLLDSKGAEAIFMVFQLDFEGANACTFCRSREELSNEYLLLVFGSFFCKMWR